MKRINGIVIKKIDKKTITVAYKIRIRDPKLKRYVIKVNKILVHDSKNEASIQDNVNIIPCAPKSKKKHYLLESIIKN
jgi:small subunit ribosomal protein S17